MAEFRFKERKELVKLTICGKEYTFDVSPSNYKYVKQISGIYREVMNSVDLFSKSKDISLEEIEKQFDLIKEKEQSFVELLLPGAWDDLFEKAGNDLMNMVDLMTFISSNIKGAGVKAKIESVRPETAKGKREI